MLLSFQETKKLLEKYGISEPPGFVIENMEQGIEFSRKNGWPVVLKILSQKDLHKTEKGFVKVGIQDERQLESAWKDFTNFTDQGAQVVLQKQVFGRELFFGIKRDKTFGVVVSFGLGGIFTEVLDDVALGICPIDRKYALEIIKSLRGYKILKGYRNQASVDIEKLASILISLSDMSLENNNIKEADFNPIIAGKEGIFAVDSKIII